MAKRYVINLGFQERVVRYTLNERRDIEKQYGKGLLRVLHEDVLASREKDGLSTLGGRLDVQFDIIWYGLRHIGNPVTEKKVTAWLNDLFEKGETEQFRKILTTCCNCIASSGILGFAISDDEEDNPEEEPGKAVASPSTSSSS